MDGRMKAEDIGLTFWSRFLPAILFAIMCGREACPFVDAANVSALANATACAAAVLLCALSLWELATRSEGAKTRAVLWAIVIAGSLGPLAWPFAEEGGVFWTVFATALLSGWAAIFVLHRRLGRGEKTSAVDAPQSRASRRSLPSGARLGVDSRARNVDRNRA